MAMKMIIIYYYQNITYNIIITKIFVCRAFRLKGQFLYSIYMLVSNWKLAAL